MCNCKCDAFGAKKWCSITYPDSDFESERGDSQKNQLVTPKHTFYFPVCIFLENRVSSRRCTTPFVVIAIQAYAEINQSHAAVDFARKVFGNIERFPSDLLKLWWEHVQLYHSLNNPWLLLLGEASFSLQLTLLHVLIKPGSRNSL